MMALGWRVNWPGGLSSVGLSAVGKGCGGVENSREVGAGGLTSIYAEIQVRKAEREGMQEENEGIEGFGER